jgi:hypothetical protein
LEFLDQRQQSAAKTRQQETGGHSGTGQDRGRHQPGQLAPLDLSKKKLHTWIVSDATSPDYRAYP